MRSPWLQVVRATPWLVLVAGLWLTSPVYSAQIVVLDLETNSALSEETRRSLEGILLSELSSRHDTNVLSANDIRALINHAPRLSSLHTLPTETVEAVAVAIDSEFILSSQVGMLGDEWVISLSLHDTKANQLFRRSTEVRVGSESATHDAMVSAARNLFREGIPEALLGPRSMSQLGFHALTLGLSHSLDTSLEHAGTYRRKIIIDLIETELDYDVHPKLEILERTSRSELTRLKTEALMAETRAQFDLKLDAQQVWVAMRGDLERVREIRSRARDLGIVPSARPLRFESPNPVIWPTSAQASAYRDTVSPLVGEIEAMLTALTSQQEETFLSYWSPEHQDAAFRRLRSHNPNKSIAASTGREFRVVPLQNLSPQMLQLAITAFLRGELLIYLCELRDGVPRGHDSVFLIRSDERWLVRHW